MANNILSIVILDQSISIYEYQDDAWEVLPIKGEQQYDHDNDMRFLEAALTELNERMNQSDNLAQYEVNVLYAENKVSWLSAITSQLVDLYQCTKLKVLRYEPLIQTAENRHNNSNEINASISIAKYVLPLAIATLSIKQAKVAEHKSSSLTKDKNITSKNSAINEEVLDKDKPTLYKHEEVIQQLTLENCQLMDTVEELKLQLLHGSNLEVENIISYLPAMFKDFWNVVPPIELANIAGIVSPPNIPSPYRSPSEQAVALQKRKFFALAGDSQEKIIDFGLLLKQHYNLEPHRVFANFFEGA